MPGWGSWQDAVPAALSFFIFLQPTTEGTESLLLGNRSYELGEVHEGGFIFLKLFLQVCPSPLVNGVCICTLLGVLWVGTHGLCSPSGASRGSAFPAGSWCFSPPTPLGESTEPALPLGEFPSILQDGEFAVFV